MLTKSDRIEKIKLFKEACLKAGFTELAENIFELKGHFSKTLTICTLIHGNEIGGIEVLLSLLEEIHSKKLIPKSNLRLILGNDEAYYEDKRFLESDMNRSFGLDKPETREELRAHELERFLLDTDVLIDIHQTIGPTNTPFFIFEFEESSYHLARYLHQTLPIVTYTRKRNFKGMTSTGYTISNSGMAVTIETGQKAVEETQISLGLAITRKAIETDFEKTLPASSMTNTFTFSQIINNHDRSLELVKTFHNFDSVKKNEILARNSHKVVHSGVDGVILFAKYGDYAKASVELALILRPVHGKEDLN